MASINLIKASNGTGNASMATVQSVRNSGVTTIVVDTVNNFPATFMGSMGTPHTFMDPVTAEQITVISEATAVDFTGHVSGSNLEIDSIAPGYTDGGSKVGDIVVIRPTTDWANNIASVLATAHSDTGALAANSVTTTSITNGAVTTDKMTATTFSGSMSGVASLSSTWQTGKSVTLPTVTAAHKYLVTATFIFSGVQNVETTARIAVSGISLVQSYVIPGSNYFTPLTIPAIFTSSATGGQTIDFQAMRSTGTGGNLDSSWSLYTIVDLGRA